jgi:cold shock CspA family protein
MLDEGQKMYFEVQDGLKGLAAENVQLIKLYGDWKVFH